MFCFNFGRNENAAYQRLTRQGLNSISEIAITPPAAQNFSKII